MCIVNFTTHSNADGRQEIVETKHLCHKAAGNQLCNDVQLRTTQAEEDRRRQEDLEAEIRVLVGEVSEMQDEIEVAHAAVRHARREAKTARLELELIKARRRGSDVRVVEGLPSPRASTQSDNVTFIDENGQESLLAPTNHNRRPDIGSAFNPLRKSIPSISSEDQEKSISTTEDSLALAESRLTTQHPVRGLGREQRSSIGVQAAEFGKTRLIGHEAQNRTRDKASLTRSATIDTGSGDRDSSYVRQYDLRADIEYEGYYLEKLERSGTGERPNWTRVGQRKLPLSYYKLVEIIKKQRKEIRLTALEEFECLSRDQQAVVSRLVDTKQAQERDSNSQWSLNLVKKCIEKNYRTRTKETKKLLVILKREPRQRSQRIHGYDRITDIGQELKAPGRNKSDDGIESTGPRARSVFEDRSALETELPQREVSLLDPVAKLSDLNGPYRVPPNQRQRSVDKISADLNDGPPQDDKQHGQPEQQRLHRSESKARSEALPHSEIFPSAYAEGQFEDLSQLSIAETAPATSSPSSFEAPGHDSEDDSGYAESIFSENSVDTSVTRLTSTYGVDISDGLIHAFILTLFCNDDLSQINAAALKDPGIGPVRFRRNVRRLIASYGKSLKVETNVQSERGAADLLGSRTISLRAAQEVLNQTENLDQPDGADGILTRETASRDIEIDELSDASQYESGDDSIEPSLVEMDLDAILMFLLGSQAYATFKSQLLRFVHKPYEKRILDSIAENGEHNGAHMTPEAIRALVQEISWVPPNEFRFSRDRVGLSTNYAKALIESIMGETWNWWPLYQRKHRLKDGYIRVSWQSPAGAARHVDLKNHAADTVKTALASAPAFLSLPRQIPSSNPPPLQAWTKPKFLNNVTYFDVVYGLAVVLFFMVYMVSAFIDPHGKRFSFSLLSAAGIVLVVIFEELRYRCARAQQRADRCAATVAAKVSSAIKQTSLSYQEGQACHTAPTVKASSAAGPSDSSPLRATTTTSQACSGVHGSGPTTLGTGNSCIESTSPLDARHVYLCINSGGRHGFSALKTHEMRTDIDFFSALKEEYLKARPWYKRWFSMWRYDHCDFYRFSKYGRNLGAPAGIDFPDKSNDDYEFDPRPVEPLPPVGPITEDEFRDRFYLSCDACHSWHQHQKQRLLFNQHDADALKALPKRKQALEMLDGKREVFWGIYARERRSFFMVCVYASLCLIIPWLVFGFLWLFVWGHSGDLQNASVPIQVSLGVAMCYIALLYESREGNHGKR